MIPRGALRWDLFTRAWERYDKAEVELRQAVLGKADDSDAQYELGFVLARRQKPEEALAHLQKAVSLDPTNASAQFQLAAVLRTLGQSKRATEVTSEFQQNKAVEFQKSQMNTKGKEANQLLLSGQPGRAAEVYRQILEMDPKNANTEYNLALALGAADDLKGEREALEKTVQLDPKRAAALAELGRMDIADGNLASAQKLLETALIIDPQMASAQGNLAVIYVLKGDNVRAESLLRQALENDANYMEGYLNLGLLLASERRFTEAEPNLEHALKLAPDNARALTALGEVKSQLEKAQTQ